MANDIETRTIDDLCEEIRDCAAFIIYVGERNPGSRLLLPNILRCVHRVIENHFQLLELFKEQMETK
jgi:hypothetical protein